MAGKPAKKWRINPPECRRVNLEQESVKEASTFKIAKCDLKAQATTVRGWSAEKESRANLTPFQKRHK
jgi:hypothetical protein